MSEYESLFDKKTPTIGVGGIDNPLMGVHFGRVTNWAEWKRCWDKEVKRRPASVEALTEMLRTGFKGGLKNAITSGGFYCRDEIHFLFDLANGYSAHGDRTSNEYLPEDVFLNSKNKNSTWVCADRLYVTKYAFRTLALYMFMPLSKSGMQEFFENRGNPDKEIAMAKKVLWFFDPYVCRYNLPSFYSGNNLSNRKESSNDNTMYWTKDFLEKFCLNYITRQTLGIKCHCGKEEDNAMFEKAVAILIMLNRTDKLISLLRSDNLRVKKVMEDLLGGRDKIDKYLLSGSMPERSAARTFVILDATFKTRES